MPDPTVVTAPPDAGVVAFSETVTDLASGAAIPGARVCVPAESGVACAISDATGTYTLQFPVVLTEPTHPTSFVASADGYLSESSLGDCGQAGDGYSIGAWGFRMRSTSSAMAALGTNAGFTFPSTTTGYLIVRTGNAAGAIATVSSAAPSPAVYGNAANEPDRSLTSVQPEGWIFFGDLAPGRVSVTVTRNGRPCTAYSPDLLAGDLPPTGSATVDANIFAGTLTDDVWVNCP
jgi:hypothetical protein